MDNLLVLETHIRQLGYQCIAGVDEAGRGPLAGPVVAAACIIPEGVCLEGVNDSKQLQPHIREALYHQLISRSDIDYGIGVIESDQIDRINILRATFEAMKKAISCLKKVPQYILVDGNHLPGGDIPGVAIVGGDCKSQMIAAASILAKVTRDGLMQAYHTRWPEYGFDKHKGYGTEQHLQALHQFGPTPIHRMSFAPLKSLKLSQQLELF